MHIHLYEVFGANANFRTSPRSDFFCGRNESETYTNERGYGNYFSLRIVRCGSY